MSQFSLGLAANVSARHIAFLETGRANPTRAMVLRLAEALEVPRSERNTLLDAAGFAAAYVSRDMSSSEMASIHAAITRMLERHEPYPGFAFDRRWTLFAVNRPAESMLASVGLKPGASLLDAFTETGPMRAAIENWPEVAAHMCVRLRTESRHLGGDATLDAAAQVSRRRLATLEPSGASCQPC
jgi:transcriptional regulator with XRE-family HTH domain